MSICGKRDCKNVPERDNLYCAQHDPPATLEAMTNARDGWRAEAESLRARVSVLARDLSWCVATIEQAADVLGTEDPEETAEVRERVAEIRARIP